MAQSMPSPIRLTMHGLSGKLQVAQNITLASTDTTNAADKVVPELNGKNTDMAFCVPTPKVMVMGLTCYLKKAAKYGDIKKVAKQALEGPLKGILHCTENQVIYHLLL